MINTKKSEEGTAKFVSPTYIQHTRLIADGSDRDSGNSSPRSRRGTPTNARVVVHRIIAAGDYVLGACQTF